MTLRSYPPPGTYNAERNGSGAEIEGRASDRSFPRAVVHGPTLLSAARQRVACGGARARSGDRQRADRIASIPFVFGDDPDFKPALRKAAELRPSHFRFVESVVALHWPAFKSLDQESQEECVGGRFAPTSSGLALRSSSTVGGL